MIVVTGADGLVGSALRDVLAQGRRPWREFVRGGGAAVEGGAERVRGDVTSGEDVARALHGATAVIHLAGVAPGMRPARSDHEVAAMRAVVEGARAARVERLVFLSTSGAALRSPHAWTRAKGEAEELLRTGGVPFTILRAGFVFAADARALVSTMQLVNAGVKLRLPLLRAGRLPSLAAGDVAIALATALDHHRMVGRTIEIGAAPELTLERLLELVAGRLGKRLELGSWPLSGIALADALAQVPGSGLTDAESWVSRFAIAEPTDLTEYQQLIPMRRVDFEEDLRSYAWGAAPPRPGDPLPVLNAPEDAGLPLFIPKEESPGGSSGAAGGNPGRIAARFGRVDPFGRVEPTDAPRRTNEPPRGAERAGP